MNESAGHVKARSYDSSGRQAAAAAARARVVDAAVECFAEQGYAGTTMAAVAARAGVSVATVHAAFGTKSALLKRAVDVAIAGDHAEVPVADRDEPRAALAELHRTGDGTALLAVFARTFVIASQRVAPLWAAMREAAAADADVATLQARAESGRLAAMTGIAAELDGAGVLRADLPVPRAGQVLWAVAAPELVERLLQQPGWDLDAVADWLGTALAELLLAPPSRPTGPSSP